MGMKLDEAGGDRLVGVECVRGGTELLLVRDDGQAKRVALAQFPLQGRSGKGVVAWKTSPGARLVGAALGQEDDRVAVHQTRSGARSLRLGDAPRRTRGGAGKTLFEVKETDRVTRIAAGSPRLEWKAPPEPEPKPSTKPNRSSRKGKPARKQPARRTTRPTPAARKAPAKKGRKPGGR
jgi:DNA gyrase subunit A